MQLACDGESGKRASGGRSVPRWVMLLFGLCIPVWVIGAMWDIELFPGFKLFQAGASSPWRYANDPSTLRLARNPAARPLVSLRSASHTSR